MKKQVIKDGNVYNFYVETPHQDKMIDYAKMSKKFMDREFDSAEGIIGNFEWHEQFPYEQYLFYHPGMGTLVGKLKADGKHNICDFGCGPGRMVSRARKFFGPNSTVDGIDISEYSISYARDRFSDGSFYVSSGIDVGEAPENHYDLVYSTIAIQHIPSKTIRENIFRGIHSILKPGGVMSIQVAYHPDLKAGKWGNNCNHAEYNSDFWEAEATNGQADMVINEKDLPVLKEDLEKIFTNVSLDKVNVNQIYSNLNGAHHDPYWAESWLFIQGTKE